MRRVDTRTCAPLIETVRRTIGKYRMIPPGAGVVVGVSGGPDSVALLTVLAELAPSMGFSLNTAHVDHGLRPESGDDALFVREICRGLGVRAHFRTADVTAVAKSAGISIEEAGRRVRYEFFDHVLAHTGASLVATAHHQDDVVETFLLRVFRGSSITGLSGIPAVRGRIIRPLIEVGRDDVLAFLRGRAIPFRTDSTNLQDTTDRNFVRNRVIPVIKERFPNFDGPLIRTIGLVAQEQALLDEQATALYAESVMTLQEEGIRWYELDVERLRSAPEVISARVVRSLVYALAGPSIRVTERHIRAVLSILDSRNPFAEVSLPGGLVAARQYTKLLISRHDSRRGQPCAE